MMAWGQSTQVKKTRLDFRAHANVLCFHRNTIKRVTDIDEDRFAADGMYETSVIICVLSLLVNRDNIT